MNNQDQLKFKFEFNTIHIYNGHIYASIQFCLIANINDSLINLK